MAGAPGGLMLPKAEGRGDIEALDLMLTQREIAHDLTLGSTRIAAPVTETPLAMFLTGDYAGDYPRSARLIALRWGAEDLSSALVASVQHRPAARYMPTLAQYRQQACRAST